MAAVLLAAASASVLGIALHRRRVDRVERRIIRRRLGLT